MGVVTAMQVLLLGQVAVIDGDVVRRVTSDKQASLLAVLASRPGDPVSRDHLVESLWGSHPPVTARNTLQVHVSALRRLLGSEAIRHDHDSYLLDPLHVALDTVRFEELTRQGVALHEEGHHEDASRRLRAALALWRGEPHHLTDSSWALSEGHRLEELRLLATTTCLRAELALGRHLLVLDELAALCDAHPTHEELAAIRVLALYRSGRQAHALEAVEQVRHHLCEELGMDPGPELRRLQEQVLRQDAVLEVPVEVRATQRPWERAVATSAGDKLVGREPLLMMAGERLGPGSVLTLVGPSGIGKTRLATELARHAQPHFASGTLVVQVPADAGTGHLAERLAHHLGLPAGTDEEHLRRSLAAADLLVVVDDLEPRSPLVADLAGLVTAGGASWVATAPRPLGLPSEVILTVPPLAARDQQGAGPGAELLLRRARQAGADLGHGHEVESLAAEVVDLLDGVPLAIELVAPDAVLGLQVLAHQLHVAREQGAHGVELSLDTSLDRLDGVERAVMAFLLTCAAPVDLDLVTSARLPGASPRRVGRAVAALVRDGLVRRQPGTHGEPVFDLAGNVASQMRPRIEPEVAAACEVALVEAAAAMPGPSQYLPSGLVSRQQAQRAMAHCAVLEVALTHARSVGSPSAWVAILRRIHELGVAQRGVGPTTAQLEPPCPPDELDPGDRVDVLIMQSLEHAWCSRPEQAVDALESALEIAEAQGDPGRISQVLTSRVYLHGQGVPGAGDTEAMSRRAVSEAERSGDPELTGGVLAMRHLVAEDRAWLQRGIRVTREHGLVGLQLLALANLADLSLETGDLDAALRLALEAGALAADLHHPYMATAMGGSAEAARAIAGSDSSMAMLAGLLELCWPDDVWTVTDVLLKLGAAARHQGLDRAAAECLGTYHAVLAWAMLPAPASDLRLMDSWLTGVDPLPPETSVEGAIRRLARYFAEPVGTDPADAPDAAAQSSTR